MANSKEYAKLGGRKMRRTSIADRYISSVWLGSDHLLLIDSMGGYVETYKRFYFADIQVFFIRKTRRRSNIAMLLSIPLALSLWGTVAQTGVARVIFGSFSAIVAFLFVVNWLKGPGAQTFIQTAVQVEELPSFNRIAKAKRHLGTIREKIQEHQGLVPADQAQSLLATGAELPIKPAPSEVMAEKPSEPSLGTSSLGQ